MKRYFKPNGERANAAFSPYFYLKTAMVLFIALAQLSACGHSMKIVKESSSKRPAWIDHPPQESNILYFVGISTTTDTLETGRNTAIKNALTKVSGYLGSKIKSVFEGRFTEMEQQLSEQIKTKSSANVHGAHVVDTYNEKTTKTLGDDKEEIYDVYVLVSFSKDEALKEIARQRQEKEEAVKRAYEYFESGLTLEEQKKYYDARKLHRQALGVLRGLDELVEIEGGKNNEELTLKLRAHIQDLNSKLSRVSISVQVDGIEGGKKLFESTLSSALSRHGFTVSAEEPAFSITGEVTVGYSSFTMESHVYYAEGSIAATRTSDNQKITFYPFKVKGFHRTKEQSSVKAVKEAGEEAGNEIAKAILKKEREEESSID